MDKKAYNDEETLMAMLWSDEVRVSPLLFVNMVYPWGQEGTPLVRESGPRNWQKDVLNAIESHVRDYGGILKEDHVGKLLRLAVVSGRGCGKSALLAWLAHWMLSTRIGSTTMVTAVTGDQLEKFTWPTIIYWMELGINSHWFDKTATTIRPVKWLGETVRKDLKVSPFKWQAVSRVWNKDNPDAFKGEHNPLGNLNMFDEAAGIYDRIWDVTYGGMTDASNSRYFMVFGNGERSKGTFHDIFQKPDTVGKNWVRFSINGRNVEGIDQTVYDDIEARYGSLSDEYRVQVKGEFPLLDVGSSFISRDIVKNAMDRDVEGDGPLLMGIDPARMGSDPTAVVFRRGLKFRSVFKFYKRKLDVLKKDLLVLIERHRPDKIYIDVGGLGYGIYDMMYESGLRNIISVNFANNSPLPLYLNRRAFCWGMMREWLIDASIPKDTELMEELIMPSYDLDSSSNKLKLESKKEMRKKYHKSPDVADALAVTFSEVNQISDIKPWIRKNKEPNMMYNNSRGWGSYGSWRGSVSDVNLRWLES